MNHWKVWQLVDSAFPGGGFAHSAGLEAAAQAGWVRDAESLREFIVASLRQQRRGGMRVMRVAHRWPERIDEWDPAWDLQLNNHVGNRASRAGACAGVGGGEDLEWDGVDGTGAAGEGERNCRAFCLCVWGSIEVAGSRGKGGGERVFIFDGARDCFERGEAGNRGTAGGAEGAGGDCGDARMRR